MEFIEAKCPHCAAALSVDPSRKTVVCEYCGSQIILGEDVSLPSPDEAEEAGYRFEKGRQRAQAEMRSGGSAYAPQTASPRKRRTWLWVIGWILIFPLPLTILMIRNKKLNIWVRIAIVAAAWIFYIGVGMSGDPADSRSTAEPRSDTTFITETESTKKAGVFEADETEASLSAAADAY